MHGVVLGTFSGHESSDRYYRSDVVPGGTAEWRPCLSVLAKGGFRFKVVFGSDLEKHFGSDLTADTRGVSTDPSVSARGFTVRPPIGWAAVCWGKQHTATAKDAVAAEGSEKDAGWDLALGFLEGDTAKVRPTVIAKQRAESRICHTRFSQRTRSMRLRALVEVCPKHFHIFCFSMNGV